MSNGNILSAFGENINNPILPEIALSCVYGILDSRHETYSATGGAATTSGNLYQCSTGTSVGGYGVIRSKKSVIYHPGEAIRARFTAKFDSNALALSLQFAGLFNLTDTIAFGYDGVDFGVILENHGVAECRTIEVTSAASGSESATITLDGDSATANLTATTAAGNAFEIARDLSADSTLDAKWNFFQNESKVIAMSKSVGAKSGSYSFSSSTATATITQDKAGLAKTKLTVKKDNWNSYTVTTNPISGNLESSGGFVFDPSVLNIYQIDYGYLGAANITFSVYNPKSGTFQIVHKMENPDKNKTSVGNPSMKIGWTSASLGSSGTNLVVQGGSASIAICAQEHSKNNDPLSLESSKSAISTTLTNVLTVRNRGHYGAIYNQGNMSLNSISINNDHNKGLVVNIIKNATLGGVPNYKYKNENDSICEYDVDGTTAAGGEVVAADIVAAGDSVNIDLKRYDLDLLPRETLTIACKTISGTSTTTDATIVWSENK